MSLAAIPSRPWGRVLVVMPTYNEADNLTRVVGHLLRTIEGVDVLIVDDASPDGTGILAEELARAQPRVHVVHGETKGGLGLAYVRGFAWAEENGYEFVVEMDADGSHPAERLAAILDAVTCSSPGIGLVVGSRWIEGGSVVNWPLRRQWFSRAANGYARRVLRVPVADITAGFRAYPLAAATTAANGINSRGYSFQIEMAMRVHNAGLSILEVPIEFREREAGYSKMSGGVVFEAMARVTMWAFGLRLREWRWPLIGGTLIWLFARVLITGIGYVSTAIHNPAVLAQRNLFSLLYYWDSSYLGAIARYGYFSKSSSPNWEAFFPGYPLVSRAIANVIDPQGPSVAEITMSMWIVTLIASLAVGPMVWRLVHDRFGTRVAAIATFLVLVGPYSLFLAASYAEALFLAAALAAWLCATRQHWLAAGLFAAIASTVRPNGLFLSAAIVVVCLVTARSSGSRINIRHILATCVGFLGTAAYFLYLYANTGSVVAWVNAQSHWGRSLQWPWLTLYQTAGRVLYASTLDRRIQFGLDIVFAIILVGAIVIFARRRAWAEVTYLGLTALSLMTSFTYMSLARNTVELFPIAVAVATLSVNPRRQWIVVAWGVAGVLLLAFNTWQFAGGLWAD
jgi:glycosyltransferase involved in cell wall biosynthesis